MLNPSSTVECVPVQRLGIEPKMNARTVALIFGKFLYLFLASLILGLVLGLFSGPAAEEVQCIPDATGTAADSPCTC